MKRIVIAALAAIVLAACGDSQPQVANCVDRDGKVVPSNYCQNTNGGGGGSNDILLYYMLFGGHQMYATGYVIPQTVIHQYSTAPAAGVIYRTTAGTAVSADTYKAPAPSQVSPTLAPAVPKAPVAPVVAPKPAAPAAPKAVAPSAPKPSAPSAPRAPSAPSRPSSPSGRGR